MEYARSRAPQPVNRVGINLAGPTMLAHGTDEQKARWLPRDPERRGDLVPALQRAGAGSDLASLATRPCASRRLAAPGPEGVDHRYAQFARWGICLARTDPDAPKHKGISYLVVDMQLPGIEMRPLVQITGERSSTRCSSTRSSSPTTTSSAGCTTGWAVANTTLAHERGTTFPFKEQVVHEVYLDELCELRGRAAARSTTWRSPTRWPRRSSSSACSGCTTGERCPG